MLLCNIKFKILESIIYKLKLLLFIVWVRLILGLTHFHEIFLRKSYNIKKSKIYSQVSKSVRIQFREDKLIRV